MVMSRRQNVFSLVVVVAAVSIQAQDLKHFESASINVQPTDAPHFRCAAGPRPHEYVCVDSLPALVAEALTLPVFTLSETDRAREQPIYSIDAIFPKGADRDQVKEMLVDLLKRRFNLRYHFAQKPVKGHFFVSDPTRKGTATVAAKSFAELVPFPIPASNNREDRPLLHPGTVPGTFELRRDPQDSRIAVFTGKEVTLSMVCEYLSDKYRSLGPDGVLVDQTSRATLYDFTIRYVNPLIPKDAAIVSPDGIPSLWRILQSTFGVHDIFKQDLAPVLVIDSVTPPANGRR